MEPEQQLSAFTRACHAGGLDIVHPFNTNWCEPALPITNGLVNRPSRLGLVIGNSRALWATMKEVLRTQPSLAGAAHPIDDHVMACIGAAAKLFSVAHHIAWAHVVVPEPIAIQRIAEQVGLARIAPSHLSIHPSYGPWFALRAVLVVDVEGPSGAPTAASNVCSGCEQPCVDRLNMALAVCDGMPSGADVRRDWRAWAAVREVCPEGQPYRYSDEQIEYHYSKNRRSLLAGT
jgi:methylmalonic aciduria homocystinuria type C protein